MNEKKKKSGDQTKATKKTKQGRTKKLMKVDERGDQKLNDRGQHQAKSRLTWSLTLTFPTRAIAAILGTGVMTSGSGTI